MTTALRACLTITALVTTTVATPLVASAQDIPKVNASLVWLGTDDFQRTFLYPLDEAKYPLMRRHLQDFFSFVGQVDESQLRTLGLEQIADGRFMTGIPLHAIDGFTINVAAMNKFELSRNREHIIDALLDAYRKYRPEYDAFFQDTFTFLTYHTRMIDQSDSEHCWKPATQVLKGYMPSHNDQVCSIDARRVSVAVSAKDYNIDHQTVRLPPLSFPWPSSSYEADWRNCYAPAAHLGPKEELGMQSYIIGQGFISTIEIPLPADKAERLFGDGKPAVLTTLVSARPVRGSRWNGAQFPELKITDVTRVFRKSPIDPEPIAVVKGPWTFKIP
jgi:hypothetical protein